MTTFEIDPESTDHALGIVAAADEVGFDIESIEVSLSEDQTLQLAKNYFAWLAEEAGDAAESGAELKPTEDASPDEETEESGNESRGEEADDDYEPMPGGQRHVEKDGYELDIERGERKAQVITLLEENRGEWVTGKDLAKLAGDLDPDEQRDRTTGSRALMNAVDYGWLDGRVEVNRRSGPHLHEYRLPAEGSESAEESSESGETDAGQDPSAAERSSQEGSPAAERAGRHDGEVEARGVPGQISKETRQHEALALLTHLVNRDDWDDTVTSSEAAEVGRMDNKNFGATMNALEDKHLVKRAEETGSGPIQWKPTGAGRAELDRLGGFQINDNGGDE